MSNIQPDQRLIVVTLTVPANTPASAPTVVVFTPQVAYYTIQKLEVVIPYGVAGLAGFALTKQGTWICPWQQPDTYIIGDNEVAVTAVDYETSGSLNLQGINSDVWPHTFTARVWYSDATSQSATDVSSTPMVPLTS